MRTSDRARQVNTPLKWLVGIACSLVIVVCAGVIACTALVVGQGIAEEAERRAAEPTPRERCVAAGHLWSAGRCLGSDLATPQPSAWRCEVGLREPPGDAQTRSACAS